MGTNPHRIPPQVCSLLLLSAWCSGTMTSILLDISVEIRIFFKKDISHRKGFRLISLSRSNRVSLMFGYAGMKVAGLERCAEELQFCQCYFQDRPLALWFTFEILPRPCIIVGFKASVSSVGNYKLEKRADFIWARLFLLLSLSLPLNCVLLQQLLWA